jgi:hypothetical protein
MQAQYGSTYHALGSRPLMSLPPALLQSRMDHDPGEAFVQRYEARCIELAPQYDQGALALTFQVRTLPWPLASASHFVGGPSSFDAAQRGRPILLHTRRPSPGSSGSPRRSCSRRFWTAHGRSWRRTRCRPST